jgi:hypothetical protein
MSTRARAIAAGLGMGHCRLLWPEVTGSVPPPHLIGGLMKRLTPLLLLVLLAALVPPSAGAGIPAGPDARTADHHRLTYREARRQIRIRFRSEVRENGYYDTYLDVGRCWRFSDVRVRCSIYYEYTDGETDEDWHCAGPMEVIEFHRSYRTQGKGIDCS